MGRRANKITDQLDKKKTGQAVFFVGILALLGLGGLAFAALPQREFSENENRYLTTLEPISLGGFWEGSVQENLTEASADQFPGRDVWVKLATGLKRGIGLRDVGGVYIGADGYYFEKILDSDISQKRYTDNLSYLEQMAKSAGVSVTFLPVPSAGSILSEKLSASAVLYDAEDLYAQAEERLQLVRLLDIRESLAAQKEAARPVYFKTDHHWTDAGAYLGYAAYCRQQGIQPTEQSAFVPVCQSKEFYGTLYSKAISFHTQPDELWLPTQLAEADVAIDGREVSAAYGTSPVYQWSKLDTKDKYGVYFGGNFAQIRIRNDAQSGGTLVVIKDSFANSVIPYLMGHYHEIVMLDLRYYNESVGDLLRDVQPDDVLVLYEMSNFAQDMNLFKLLR